ncbi:MAG TPA: glycosyltransferase [Pseudonocardiaceae bacterium]|jgi:hypothetical protein
MITAVGIVVPARDEQRLIRRCLHALTTALRALPSGVEPALCVVADRCADRTAELAAETLRGWPARLVTNQADLTIGEIRDLGLRRAYTALAAHPPSEVLLLSTDADSLVPADWVQRHVRLIEQGADAVAGMVELSSRHRLPTLVAARYASVLAKARTPDGHGNVYAANLGVRAGAYLAVGGFEAVASGEDHRLWHRLGSAGYRRRYAAESTVLTSARRHGRAPGGLAELLHTLHLDSTDAVPDALHDRLEPFTH